MRNFTDYNFSIYEGNKNIIRFAVLIRLGDCSFSMGKEAKNSAINTSTIGCFCETAVDNYFVFEYNVRNKF